jgi:hypothetical protein
VTAVIQVWVLPWFSLFSSSLASPPLAKSFWYFISLSLSLSLSLALFSLFFF